VSIEERVWRVDVARREASSEPVPLAWQRLGGRGLIARILLDEVPPRCEPLGSQNKLIWAPGLIVGHRVSSCDRISVGGKSPLTGGVKESNAGGTTGLQLVWLGIKALLLEGELQGVSWSVLHVSREGIRFESADGLLSLGAYAAAEELRGRYGDQVAIGLIGPGGEMCLPAAGILNLDKDREPSRINARGGMGALMGARRLKAIVVDGAGGEKPPLADAELFKAAQKLYTQALMDHPQIAVYRDYGTAGLATMTHGFGALPTRGFSAGEFEGIDKISGEALRDLMLARGGDSDTSHACMAGCVIRSSNCFADPQGKKTVSPLEYETIGLVGSNLGIDDLDEIGQLNWQINDLGLDTIDIGAALGLAAQAGLMHFGDASRARALLDEVRRGTPLGRILGSGAQATGRALGVSRVPTVKGQAMPAYDPRAIKGTGVTYATSPQGADHTCGLTIRAKVDHLDPKVQADLSRAAQINMAGYDTLGACIFGAFGFAKAPGAIRDLINGRYGWDVDDDILQHLGRQTLKIEREFNRAAGFQAADDRIPEWMTQERLPPHNSVFDVEDGDLDRVAEWS
jgi:aldehyde:ferredoxin oxidoreductase